MHRQGKWAAVTATLATALVVAGGCSPKIRVYPGVGGAGGGATTSSGSSAGGSGGISSATTGMPCTPETDPAFCARLGKTCEAVTDLDSCGLIRTVDCGVCTAPQACLANVCSTPVCASLTFAGAAAIPELSAANTQDAVQGVTPTASTILVQRGAPCGGVYSLYLADETSPGSGTYTTIDVPALTGMDTSHEQSVTLTSDGLTIIAPDTSNTAFLASSRSAVGLVDFGPGSPTEFAAIVPIGLQTLTTPSISGDGLAFYYVVVGDAPGIYESVRASTTVPFPLGTLLPAPAQDYLYVTAVSSDRLTLFLQTGNYGMAVLTRSSLSAPFANPDAPNPAPTVPGFRARPLGDCKHLIATCTPGGCSNEDTCLYVAQ